MIIDYDHNPNATTDEKLQSLKESVQLSTNEMANAIEILKKEIQELKKKVGD
jgi:hypothetical protein